VTQKNNLSKVSYLAVFSVLMMGMFEGCSSENTESLVAQGSSEVVYYEGNVKEIISVHCLSCHSGTSPQVGLDLSSYTSLRNVASATEMENNLLLNVLKGQNGAPQMPTSGAISIAEIELIEKWIDGGLLKSDAERAQSEISIGLSSVTSSSSTIDLGSSILSSESTLSNSMSSTEVNSSSSTEVLLIKKAYKEDVRVILELHCVGCHGTTAGVNLESFANVKLKAGRMMIRIEEGTMPPKGPLQASEIQILRDWIDGGMIESNQKLSSTPVSSEVSSSISLSSTPVSSEVSSSAALSSISISSQATIIKYTTDIAPILNSNCVSCHGSSGGVSLSNYSEVKLKANRILIRTENGTMPKKPNSPLTTAQIQLIKDWIAAGTPE
jgi:mono/diheme cytochrome c family protein